jgi:hypothetical protein
MKKNKIKTYKGEFNPSVKNLNEISEYWHLLQLISDTNNLDATFTPFFCMGQKKDVEKAQEIFINSIIYN